MSGHEIAKKGRSKPQPNRYFVYFMKQFNEYPKSSTCQLFKSNGSRRRRTNRSSRDNTESKHSKSRSKNHNRKNDRSKPAKNRPLILPLSEKMDEEDLQRCLSITTKLADSIYAFCYKTPPLPDDDDQLNFDKSVSKPMYFDTIITNLQNSAYSTVQSWKNDVNLIFDNAMNYYSPRTMRYDAALELKDKFTDLLSVFDKSEEELWMEKLDYLCNEYANAENEE